MKLSVETLQEIQRDAAHGPAAMLDVFIRDVQHAVQRCTPDVQAYAKALLLKLEHLAQRERAEPASGDTNQEFLAPWLTSEPPSLTDAA